MSAQLTRIHTLAACRKAVLPATLAVLMGAPALAPAAWNWGLAGPKIYWAEVIKSEQAAAQQGSATQPSVPDTLYIHGDDLAKCQTSVFPNIGWSILVSTMNVNDPPAELVAECVNENTISAVCPPVDELETISGALSTNGICADIANGATEGIPSSQFNDGQYIIDIALKQQARDRSGVPFWVRGTSLGNMPVHVDSYWEWLDALEAQVQALEAAVGMPYDNLESLDKRVSDLEQGGGVTANCGTTPVSYDVAVTGTLPRGGYGGADEGYFSLQAPSLMAYDNVFHNQAGVACNGTLDNFEIVVSGSPSSGDGWVFTVMKNGQATNLACTIQDSATSCNDIPDTLTLNAGDQISVEADEFSEPDSRTVLHVKSRFTPGGGPIAPIF